MPVAVVRAYSQAIPRLQAEEALHMLDVAMMGHSATVELSTVQTAQREWQRSAQGGRKQRAARPTPEALAAMGIATIGVPAAPAETGKAVS